MPVGRTVLAGHPRNAAGQRNHWVEIEQQPAEPAGGDFPVEDWTALTGAWMSRLDLRADERFAANADAAFAETQWQMPYVSTMDPDVIDVPGTRRLKYRGRIYNIRSATIMERRSGIEFITIAKV